ncbi:tetratricopeptide repeat protein [Tenacibaculum amylolyticum]|uniref:tetratricopeptide repeat protein n=1 Tax=Tenacibaculum amylolyticum TaxID=104269 RepID=UPI003894258A
MHKATLLLFLFLRIFYIQSQVIDTTLVRLENNIKNASTDSLKVETLLKLCSYQKKRDYNKVIIYCEQIFTILKNVSYDTRRHKAKTYNHRGIYKRRQSNHIGALKDYFIAEEIFNELQDSTSLASIYHNIGYIYRAQKEYDKSINNFKKAIAINTRHKRHRSVGNNYNMMSQGYKDLNQIDSAFYVVAKAISYFELDGYEEGKQQAIANKATLYSYQEKHDIALEIYLNYLKYVTNIGKIKSIITTNLNIANTYFLTKNYEKALYYVNNAITIATRENNKKGIHNGYMIRSKIYTAINNHDLALKDVEKYTIVSEEINSTKNARKLKEIELLNQYQKKRLKDSILKAGEKRNTLIKAKNEELQKQLYTTIVVIIILIVISTFYFGYNYYVKTKKKQLGHKIEDSPIEKLTQDLPQLSETKSTVSLEEIIFNLKNNAFDEDKIATLKENIKTLNTDFLKRLKQKHPKLTKTDIEVCSFIKVGLSRREIANLRRTSIEAIKSTRFRLKKKLELTKEDALDEYIKNL